MVALAMAAPAVVSFARAAFTEVAFDGGICRRWYSPWWHL